MSSRQLLQIFPILCSTWTTTLSTGKAWMRGSCTACDRLQSRGHHVSGAGTLQSRAAHPSRAGGVSLPATQRVSSPLTSCFCSTPSIHMSVHAETTEGLSDRQWQQWPCWLYSPCQMRTVTNRHRHTASSWLLVPLRHSQCSWLSDVTERGSLQASWQSIRPLIFQGGSPVGLWSCCFSKNCLFT